MSWANWLVVTGGGWVGWTLATFAFIPDPDHANQRVHRLVWGIGSAAWLTYCLYVRWLVPLE